MWGGPQCFWAPPASSHRGGLWGLQGSPVLSTPSLGGALGSPGIPSFSDHLKPPGEALGVPKSSDHPQPLQAPPTTHSTQSKPPGGNPWGGAPGRSMLGAGSRRPPTLCPPTPRSSLGQDLVEQSLGFALLLQVGLGALLHQLLQVVGVLLHARQQVVQDVAAALPAGRGSAPAGLGGVENHPGTTRGPPGEGGPCGRRRGHLLNLRSWTLIWLKSGRSRTSSAQQCCISCPSSSSWHPTQAEGRKLGRSPLFTRSMISAGRAPVGGAGTQRWLQEPSSRSVTPQQRVQAPHSRSQHPSQVQALQQQVQDPIAAGPSTPQQV